MSFKIADIDFIFLSFDEPNAEKNFADLKRKVPWAKRVHGVYGFDAAHKAMLPFGRLIQPSCRRLRIAVRLSQGVVREQVREAPPKLLRASLLDCEALVIFMVQELRELLLCRS